MNTPNTSPSTSSGINVDVRSAAGASTALTAVIVWVIQTYAFNGNLPPELSATLYALLPGAVGALFAHIALQKMPPGYINALKQRIRTGPVTALPTMTDPNLPLTAENPTGKDDNPFGGVV